jgi:polyketide biosynthesis acyl carrier protein
MTREQIMEVVTKHIRSNIYGLDERPIVGSQSMLDLGASSLDIIEIVSSSMRELEIKVPRTQLTGLKNIDELVDVFHRAKQESHA